MRMCNSVGLDYMRPEYERLQEVNTVQCIWQQPVPHFRDFDDSTLINHQLGSSIQAMYRQRLFTDATIVVEGQALPVHRAVLAAASPVFERMFSSHMQEGESTLCVPLQLHLDCSLVQRAQVCSLICWRHRHGSCALSHLVWSSGLIQYEEQRCYMPVDAV